MTKTPDLTYCHRSEQRICATDLTEVEVATVNNFQFCDINDHKKGTGKAVRLVVVGSAIQDSPRSEIKKENTIRDKFIGSATLVVSVTMLVNALLLRMLKIFLIFVIINT